MVKRLSGRGRKQVLLIDEEYPYEERCEMYDGTRVVLTRSHVRDLGREETELMKYQSIDILATEIMKVLYDETSLIGRPGGRRTRILGVYSPIHRIGKTTFALKLGKDLAARGNVLYVNLEDYAGIGGIFPGKEEQDLSQILYYAKQDGNDISVRISTVVEQMGRLDYIPPMKVWTDLQSVTFQEWQLFLEKLGSQSIYDTIILDIGNAIENLFGVLGLCDRILFPLTQDTYAQAKMNQYRYMQKVLEYQELEAVTIYVDMSKPLRQAVKETIDFLDEEGGKERRSGSGRTAS